MSDMIRVRVRSEDSSGESVLPSVLVEGPSLGRQADVRQHPYLNSRLPGSFFFFLLFYFNYLYVFVHDSVCGCVDACANPCGGQRHQLPLELELQLGSEQRSPGRTFVTVEPSLQPLVVPETEAHAAP